MVVNPPASVGVGKARPYTSKYLESPWFYHQANRSIELMTKQTDDKYPRK